MASVVVSAACRRWRCSATGGPADKHADRRDGGQLRGDDGYSAHCDDHLFHVGTGQQLKYAEYLQGRAEVCACLPKRLILVGRAVSVALSANRYHLLLPLYTIIRPLIFPSVLFHSFHFRIPSQFHLNTPLPSREQYHRKTAPPASLVKGSIQ